MSPRWLSLDHVPGTFLKQRYLLNKEIKKCIKKSGIFYLIVFKKFKKRKKHTEVMQYREFRFSITFVKEMGGRRFG